jgi:predicted PurR-regulated permease PerM
MAAPPQIVHWLRPFVILAGSAIALVLLWWAQTVLVPIALAVLLTFLLSPLVSWLQRQGLGRVPAVVVVVLFAAALVVGIGWLVSNQVRALVDSFPAYEVNIRQRIDSFKSAKNGGFLERFNTMVDHIGQALSAKKGEATPVTIVDESPFRFTQIWAVAAPLLAPLASVGLAVVLVIFMLLKREDLRDRVISLMGHGRVTVTTKALDEAGKRISRYLLMQALINGTFGLAIFVGLWLIGVDYPLLWGFLAATLRYIPYLGPWAAAMLPLGMTLLVSPTWTSPLLVVLLFLVVEFVSNMIMEPWLYGRGVGVSEAATLVMVAFWTWLWGPIGLVLATPLTVCLAVMGRYVPFLKFLDTLLSDQPALDPHLGYYQRLIAKDQDEAEEIAEEHLVTNGLDPTFDALLIPALTFTRRDVELGKLDDEDQRFALKATQEIAEGLGALQDQADRAQKAASSEGTLIPAVVLCCPARDETDRVATLMLKESLDPRQCQVSVASSALLASEVVQLVESLDPAVVCIAALPPGGLAHTRLLCIRLRGRFPGLKIVVGRWGLKGNLDKNREAVLAAGADRFATTLAETHKQVLAFAQLTTKKTAMEAPLRESPAAELASQAS